MKLREKLAREEEIAAQREPEALREPSGEQFRDIGSHQRPYITNPNST